MPAWLISLLVSLAFKIGMPLLLKRFPGIPQWVVDIILKLETNMAQSHPDTHPVLKAQALAECRNGFCAPDLKKTE